jgi:hypothetical protein
MMRREAWLCVAIVATSGCIQGELDLPDFQLTDVTGGLPDPTLTTLTTTVSTSISSTSVSSTSVGDDTSSSGDTSDDTTTGELPTSVCDPQPEDIETAVIFDSKIGWEHEQTDLVTDCIVTWVGPIGTALHIGLACDDGGHSLDVSDVGPTAISPGDHVELAVYIDVPWWANVYVTIRRDGEVMLAAMDADSLPGEGVNGSDPDFFAPLQLALLDDVCEVEPIVEEPCDFVCADPCTVDRRQAIAFLDGSGAEVVYDRNAGQLGETTIEVGEAIEHVEVDCVDMASAKYSFVALRG